MDKPNVVIITCHDLGDYLGPYGVPVETPNLDAVAQQGVVMENHFSTGSVCSPSRGSLMTGCYPHTTGLMGLTHRGWELEVDRTPHLAALMDELGYDTYLFGFQHEHPDRTALGYKHHVRPPKGYDVEQVVPLFTEWLHKREDDGRPFFAAVGFSETHRMGGPNFDFKRDVYESADPAEVEVPPFLPDIPEVRQDLADFYGAVNLVDKMVGLVVKALEETGLSGRTLLIFTSDHGASFMHSKATLYDGGTKVAMLARWPGVLPAGHRCPALTSHVDVVPTLFDLLDLTVPREAQGHSFAAAARGRDGGERDYVFAERNYTNYYDPARMVRSQSFKYIRKGLRTCIFDFVIPELEQCSSSFRRKREVFEFYSSTRCTEELYDLEADPGEMNNLAEDPACESTLDMLRSALAEHLARTDDPFRHLRNELLMPADGYARQQRGK